MTSFKIFITTEGGVVKDVYVNREFAEGVEVKTYDLDDEDDEKYFIQDLENLENADNVY